MQEFLSVVGIYLPDFCDVTVAVIGILVYSITYGLGVNFGCSVTFASVGCLVGIGVVEVVCGVKSLACEPAVCVVGVGYLFVVI